MVICAQAAVTDPVSSQVVRGQVKDAESEQPVPSARIAVRNEADSLLTEVMTGTSGEFTLLGLPRGRLILDVSALGYTASAERMIDHEGESLFLAIELHPAPLTGEGIQVTVEAQVPFLRERGYYDRERRGLGRFITPSQLNQMSLLRTSDIFRRTAAVIVRGGEPVMARGTMSFQNCRPAVYQDGMLIRPENSRVPFNDVVAPPVWIQAIEIYPGPATAPPQWRGSAACGVIVIWTRH